MSDDQQDQPSRVRRSSFAGQTFADLFGTSRSSAPRQSGGESSPPTQQLPGPITQAAAQAQRRRMSLTTLGLSGSPGQTSPFGSFRGHRDSISSANSGSADESAIAEDDGPGRESSYNNPPASPSFARRTSFGARALRDIRTGSISGAGGGGGPGSPGQNGIRSPTASSRTTAQNSNNAGTISSRDSKGRGLSFATNTIVSVRHMD